MNSLGVLLSLLGLVGLATTYFTPRLVRSGGRPLAEPRIFSYLDAWQTVIFDAKDDASRIRGQLMDLFTRPEGQRFACRSERVWYWGLDGKTEREQIVLSHGRGLVFCQIHEYGSDLYVGWDAHLNLGSWAEKRVASGVDRETGQRVSVMSVEPATRPVTEYDLADLNCLLEWTHAQITKVVKQYLQERRIDQEIDFAIIRGNRQNAVPAEEKRPARSFFRRKA